MQGAPVEVTVEVVFARSGEASTVDAKIAAEAADAGASELRACVVSAFRAARVPPYVGVAGMARRVVLAAPR